MVEVAAVKVGGRGGVTGGRPTDLNIGKVVLDSFFFQDKIALCNVNIELCNPCY